MKLVKHAAIILAALFVTLGIPMLYYLDAGTLFPDGQTRFPEPPWRCPTSLPASWWFC